MANAIMLNGTGSGGGGGSVDRGVIFIDYDGSIVTSWPSADVAEKNALPANPTHTGLIAQGWNWTLADIKQYIADYPEATVVVGQMYATASGLTEMDITLTGATGLTVTCNMVGNKDWGDGTTDSTTSHTYSNHGNYTITCDGNALPSGTVALGGMFGSSVDVAGGYICTAARIGSNITSIPSRTFASNLNLVSITIPSAVTTLSNCLSNSRKLVSITIPNGVTKIENEFANNCFGLTSISIPNGVTSTGYNICYNCRALKYITIPNGLQSISSTFFRNCYSLTNVTIPDGVTSISSSVFYGCYNMTNVTIPDGVTSIGTEVFRECSRLTGIKIPSGVTNIGTYTFYSCTSVQKFDFTTATQIPTLANVNAFNGINGFCKIVVPDALYDTWKTATNWATYADHIYKASEVT